MKSSHVVAALFATLLATSATDTLARDHFDADWSPATATGGCKKDEQCWIEIRKPGKANHYTLRFVVADRFDHRKVHCSAEATAEKSQRGNFLRGKFTKSGQMFDVFPWRGGQIEMQAVGSSPCDPSVLINGLYGAIGD
jgi:hypothetical protein